MRLALVVGSCPAPTLPTWESGLDAVSGATPALVHLMQLDQVAPRIINNSLLGSRPIDASQDHKARSADLEHSRIGWNR
jgi:hypothetical protein